MNNNSVVLMEIAMFYVTYSFRINIIKEKHALELNFKLFNVGDDLILTFKGFYKNARGVM